MENKKTDVTLTIGIILILITSFLSVYNIIGRLLFLLSILGVNGYMYYNAQYYSGYEKGSSKWKTYRYLTLFGLFCICSMYSYATFFMSDGSSQLQGNLFVPILIAVFGNMAPKIGYNQTLGLRLPWTLESEECWRYAHRMVGYTSIPCVLIILIALVFDNAYICIGTLLLWILIPSILSYQYANKRNAFHWKVHLYDFSLWTRCALILMVLSTIALYPFLPNDLPMQFGSSGQVNWTLPKMIGVCVISIITLCMLSYKYSKNDARQFILSLVLALFNMGFLSYIAFFL